MIDMPESTSNKIKYIKNVHIRCTYVRNLYGEVVSLLDWEVVVSEFEF